MNSIVALPIAAAVPVAPPALANSQPSQNEYADAAAMLVRAEKAIDTFRTRFISEDFMMDNDEAERALRYFRRAAEGYPDDEDEWNAVLDFFHRVGGGVLSWILTGDPGVMICLTAALAALERNNRKAANADGRLLETVDRIFKLQDVIDEFDPEIGRLHELWATEMIRLYEEDLTGEHSRSSPERRAIVAAMPECIEHTRLVELQRPHFDAQDKLITEVMSTPALTSKGRQEKFFVLLNCIMPDEWRDHDSRVDYEIKQARNFMIELVGGEEAEQLREQFA
jgi:hypothetical protein